MGDTTGILGVSSSTTDEAVSALTAGFISDPVMRWMYPDAHSYLESFPRLVREFAKPSLEEESFYAPSDCFGAALWLAPGKTPDEEAVAGLIETDIRPEIREDMYTMLEQMDTYHPSDVPCWYLAFIGVDISCQGRGLGSKLMKHALERVDEEGVQAYLESSNPANMSLYERHGFRVMGRIDAGSAPPIHPMLRPAK